MSKRILIQPEYKRLTVSPDGKRLRIVQDSKRLQIADQGLQGPEGPPPEGSSMPQLTELLSLENTDLALIYDTSTSTTKHVQLSTLKAFILA